MLPEDIGEGTVDQKVDGIVALYTEEISIYEREAMGWETRARKVIQRYKSEQGTKNPKKRLNLLWANIKTMLPALYMRAPKADISKRFNNSGATGRIAALVLEKVTNYYIAECGLHRSMRKAVRGFLLPGRGTLWVRYVPHMQPVEPAKKDDDDTKDQGPEATRSGVEVTDQQPINEEVVAEEVCVDFVHYEDFGHNVARVWEEVYLVWRRVYMDREELKARFPKKYNDIPLDYQPKTSKGGNIAQAAGKAIIYEGWDKKRRKAFWLHKSVSQLLDERDNPLKLQGFFPTPEPLLANLADDSLIPTPDFAQWQDQANQIDELTARINSIARSLKVAGVYDSSAEGVDRLLSEGIENKLIAVDQWALFAEKGGLQGVINFMPMEEIMKVLTELFEARDKCKEEAYEITGMSDILRGATDPEETYGAQKIKSQYANLRLEDGQHTVHTYARDIVNLMAEVIATHFSVATLKEISDMKLFDSQEQKQQVQQQIAMQAQQMQQQATQGPVDQRGASPTPQLSQSPVLQALFPGSDEEELTEIMASPTWEEVEALLRSTPARSFKLDIETKSTVKLDEQEDKDDRVELISAVGGFLGQIDSVAEKQPLLVPLLCRLLMFGVRAFPVGKDLEEAFQITIAKLEKQAANPQPKPDPAQIKAEAQKQIEQAKMEAAAQSEQLRVQADQQIEQNRLQHEKQLEAMRLQNEQRSEETKQRWQQWQVEQQQKVEMAAREQEARMEMLADRVKQEVEGQTKIIVAHISAAAVIESARIKAAASDGADAENREASGEQ